MWETCSKILHSPFYIVCTGVIYEYMCDSLKYFIHIIYFGLSVLIFLERQQRENSFLCLLQYSGNNSDTILPITVETLLFLRFSKQRFMKCHCNGGQSLMPSIYSAKRNYYTQKRERHADKTEKKILFI